MSESTKPSRRERLSGALLLAETVVLTVVALFGAGLAFAGLVRSDALALGLGFGVLVVATLRMIILLADVERGER